MRGLIGSARSVEGRTLAILLLSVLAVHAGALFLYQRSAISAADEAFASTVATRLTLAREAILRRPADQRAAEAKALSSPHFEVGWAPTRIIQPDEAANPFLWALRGRVTALEPSLSEADLAFWIKEPGVGVDFQELDGALTLPDGSVLTFRSAHSPNLARLGPWALLSTAVALFVGLCATLLMHRIGVPLRRLSEDTEKIGRGAWIAVAESGLRETRTIARALNAMQARIQALVAERTQALAAVSHDLRTPITRLRLRLGGELTEAERQAMSVDLDDMQAMIDSTLAYLRGEDDPEQPQRVNLSSLLTSIADAAWDTGRSVVFEGPPRTLAELRPVAFRRAVQNLVDNAVRYGGCARIALSTTASGLTVWIDDDGPGIAADDRKRVFEPFVRLETSRNRETGGSGLGLTIARRTIEQHGGSIALENRSPYGLRVELVLPRSGASAHDTF